MKKSEIEINQNKILYDALIEHRKWDAVRACNNIIDALITIRADFELPMMARNCINDVVKKYTALSNIIGFDTDAEDSEYDGLSEALIYYNDNISTACKF